MLEKKDFINILEQYNIGKYKNSKHMGHAHANNVYRLRTTKGDYILKQLLFFDKKKELELKTGQHNITENLYNQGVPVPHFIKSKHNNFILDYKDKKVIIQTYFPGKSVKKLTDKQALDLAKKVGKMHRILLKIRKNKYKIPAEEIITKLKRLNDIPNNIRGISTADRCKLLKDNIQSINLKKLRMSIIHKDIRGDNIVIYENRIRAIIDWDDICYDYLCYEIGVIIYSFFVRPDKCNKKQINIFLKEYQKYISFNEEEKKAAYYFALLRIIGVIGFFRYKIKINNKKKKEYEDIIYSLIKRYLCLEKISIGEFTKLFD